MAAGHDLSDRVHGHGGDMGGVDFHTDERACVGHDAQSGLRAAAAFRIFFLSRLLRRFLGIFPQEIFR